MIIKRRGFLKFAGLLGLFGGVASEQEAEAATWQKVAIPPGRARLPGRAGRAKHWTTAAGSNSSIAVRSDGAIFACGYNTHGGLGDNTATSRSTYVSAIGISNAAMIGTGSGHAIALRSDGVVCATGNNVFGQLGDNTTTSRFTYVSAVGISNAVAIAAGNSHTIALRSDGAIFACGYNLKGPLGINTATACSTYVSSIGV